MAYTVTVTLDMMQQTVKRRIEIPYTEYSSGLTPSNSYLLGLK